MTTHIGHLFLLKMFKSTGNSCVINYQSQIDSNSNKIEKRSLEVNSLRLKSPVIDSFLTTVKKRTRLIIFFRGYVTDTSRTTLPLVVTIENHTSINTAFNFAAHAHILVRVCFMAQNIVMPKTPSFSRTQRSSVHKDYGDRESDSRSTGS